MKPYLCALPLALVLAGCRSEPPVQLVPVRGRATLAQKPLGRVTIQLLPDGAKKGTPSAVGQTEADGSFHLTTPPHGEGAVPGKYKVTVTSYTGKGVPASYGNPRDTPLRIEIPAGGLENWDLKLKSP